MRTGRVTMVWCAFLAGGLSQTGCDESAIQDFIDETVDVPGASDAGNTVYVGDANGACSDDADRGVFDEGDSVTASVVSHTVRVTDTNAVLNCCLEGWMEATVDGNTIVVREIEEDNPDEMCRCVCGRPLSVEIPELAEGTYAIMVYRAETLLAELSVAVGASVDTEAAADTEEETEVPTVSEIVVGECLGNRSADDAAADENAGASSETEAGWSTYLVTQGDTVVVIDEAVPLNCCAEVDVQVLFDTAAITVVESEIVGEEGLCRCTCPRDISTTIDGLSVGEYAVDVVRVAYDGVETRVASLPFRCVDTPSDWSYDGVTCVN